MLAGGRFLIRFWELEQTGVGSGEWGVERRGVMGSREAGPGGAGRGGAWSHGGALLRVVSSRQRRHGTAVAAPHGEEVGRRRDDRGRRGGL